MKFAVFSDIHANLEALETAVSFAEGRGIQRFVVLGDTIGYGADPNDCFEWVLNHASVNLFGNHERALIEPELKNKFTPLALEAIEWTGKILKPKFIEKIPDLSYIHLEEGITFTHGSPNDPEAFHYLMSFEDAINSFQVLQTEICFVGHTHIPGCICEQKQSAEYLKPGIFTLETNERFILNPGSVGQPRDLDPRLSFGIYDPEARTFEIVRLEYDNRKAAEKIRKAGLPSYLADRLL